VVGIGERVSGKGEDIASGGEVNWLGKGVSIAVLDAAGTPFQDAAEPRRMLAGWCAGVATTIHEP
jgi:hypothetical protein